MRVLHVVKGLGPGGAERLLVSMAAVADPTAVHHEVAYLLDWKQHLVPELEALGVPDPPAGRARGACSTHAGRGGCGRWRRPFDVVHLHSPGRRRGRPPGRCARCGPARSLVSTEHNVWSSHGRLTRVANALTLPLDRVRWAVSEEVVASTWPPWRAKTEVLVHGVPLAALQARRGERAAARAAQGWADDDVVVAIVANLRANKDYPTLFAAAAARAGRGAALRFVSIGQGPLEARAARARWPRCGLGDRFVMLGYHDDPPAVLAGADVFTLSSRHEGLPISLLEAMALGLPPVVTAVGGNAEVVTDDVDGLLVPPATRRPWRRPTSAWPGHPSGAGPARRRGAPTGPRPSTSPAPPASSRPATAASWRAEPAVASPPWEPRTALKRGDGRRREGRGRRRRRRPAPTRRGS